MLVLIRHVMQLMLRDHGVLRVLVGFPRFMPFWLGFQS